MSWTTTSLRGEISRQSPSFEKASKRQEFSFLDRVHSEWNYSYWKCRAQVEVLLSRNVKWFEEPEEFLNNRQQEKQKLTCWVIERYSAKENIRIDTEIFDARFSRRLLTFSKYGTKGRKSNSQSSRTIIEETGRNFEYSGKNCASTKLLCKTPSKRFLDVAWQAL